MKININDVADILKKNKLEPAVLRKVIEEINQKVAEKAPEAPADKLKAQFLVVVGDNQDVAWIAQIEEGANPATFIDRIKKAGYDYNASRKGARYPVKSISEALEVVPRKFWKVEGQKTLVKTKTPVLIVRTDNKL